MKLTIPKKELKEALVNLSKVVQARPGLPILGAVKFASSKEEVTVSATNLEQTLSWKIRDCEGGGSFIVDLKELKDYLKQGGTSATVQFEDVGDRISAIFHSGNVPVIKQFKQFPIDDWPKILKAEGKGNPIKQGALMCIQKVIPCTAGKNDGRRTLQGILLEPDAVVATSGKELVKLHCQTGVKESLILPVTKFIKSAKFAEKDAVISFGGKDSVSFCEIESDKWTYSTKFVCGNYPNYRQVIPNNHNASLAISEEDIDILKKEVTKLQGDEEHNTINLYADDKIVQILPENIKGKALSIKGVFRGSESVAIALNREYLLRALDLGFSKLYFQGDGFSPVVANDHTGLFVFMPLRNADSEKIKDAAIGKTTVVQTGRDTVDTVSKINTKPEIQKKEKTTMPEENKNRKLGFQVVDGSEIDPFEELLNSINETRIKAKEVYDMAGTLSKKVKDVQRVQKAKEREFNHTRDLLGKLKKVSGF